MPNRYEETEVAELTREERKLFREMMKGKEQFNAMQQRLPAMERAWWEFVKKNHRLDQFGNFRSDGKRIFGTEIRDITKEVTERMKGNVNT